MEDLSVCVIPDELCDLKSDKEMTDGSDSNAKGFSKNRQEIENHIKEGRFRNSKLKQSVANFKKDDIRSYSLFNRSNTQWDRN